MLTRRSIFAWFVAPAALACVSLAACSGAERRSGFDADRSSTDPAAGGGSFGGAGTDGGAPTGSQCAPNPDNYDIPGNNCDDDGDGTVDNPPSCDEALGEVGSAEEFARALGICTSASDKGYGLVSATFTKGYNETSGVNHRQHGVLPKFGDVLTPREGKRLGVLSSGYAQEFDGQPGAKFVTGKDWSDSGTDRPGALPPGFPKPASGCDISNDVHDVIGVKLELKAPRNASGVKFDFNFFTAEWPRFVCSEFNDGFLAYLTSSAFNNGQPDNMSFDSQNNPVSVNNGFFDRCTPNADIGCAGKPGKAACPGGAGELAGTGFGLLDYGCNFDERVTTGGATGWLTSQAPVKAGETFTLELMIWDTGDAVLDSSVLLDNFTWAQGEVETSTERPR